MLTKISENFYLDLEDVSSVVFREDCAVATFKSTETIRHLDFEHSEALRKFLKETKDKYESHEKMITGIFDKLTKLGRGPLPK